MRNLRLPAFLTAVAVSVSAVFAHTEIREMGHAPVLGLTPSTPELRQKFAEHPEIVREAARQIGLTPAEYAAFMKKFKSEKPGWGTIPRHLDAMTWAANGQVYAIRDVTIPAGTNGWEVDLHEKHQLVAIYIPMICGNLSIVRRPIHEVAALQPRPALPPRYVPAPPPPAPVPVPLVAAEVPPAQELPPPAPAPVVHHPHLFWPILAAAVVGIVLASDHHHGGSSTPSTPVTPVTPVQPPVTTGGTSSQPGLSSGTGGVVVPSVPMHGCNCDCGCGSSGPSSSGGSIGGSSNGLSAGWAI